MYDKARCWYWWMNNGGRNRGYERKRSLFYLNVLKWQLNDRGIKRVHILDKGYIYPEIKMFCGNKKKHDIGEEETEIILRSMSLKKTITKGERKYG